MKKYSPIYTNAFGIFRRMAVLLALVVFSATAVSVYAQNPNGEKSQSKGKLIKMAKNALYEGDIFTATDCYQKVDDKYPGDVNVQKTLANLY